VSLLIGVAEAAELTFVSPRQGSQVFGPNAIEVTTTAAAVDRVEFYVDGSLAGVARRPPYRIAFDFGSDLKSRTITAKVLSNGFKTSDTASIATAALTAGESISVDVVEVPLRVRSDRALKPGDVRVVENSVDQSVREITATRGPAHFAFIVDRSLSMGDGRLPAALRAVDEALTMLRAGDTASLVLFNHIVTKARPLSRQQPAAAALADTRASGGTSLRDAVSSISARQRTYAVVITDGGDRNSVTTEKDALRQISGTKTIVAAVVLGDAGGFLQRAARNTGGTIASASAATVGRALRGVIADINSRYTVVYQSQGTKRGWRTIAITPRGSGIEIVSARKGYFAE
jgi:hypothetical protein